MTEDIGVKAMNYYYTCRNSRISAEAENRVRNLFPRKIWAKFRILKIMVFLA